MVSSSPLISSCEHLQKPNGCIIGTEVAQAILPKFPSFSSAIPTEHMTPRAALRSTDRRNPITHGQIHDFINNEVGNILHRMNIGRGNRVALVLPNGPELALAIMAVSNWACCVPLNAFGAHSELKADLKASGADLVVGMMENSGQGHADGNGIPQIAREVGIPFCGLMPSQMEAGVFRLIPPSVTSLLLDQQRNTIGDNNIGVEPRFRPNSHEDEVLVLFTSGTTGQKKVVPHLLGDILVATATICVSWKLTPTDVNCNLMPLFHVGGIIRQVFSPIFSGGCVICCPSFDPSHFWSLLVNNQAFTWYYAAPTMHQLILETGKRKGLIGKNGSVTTSPKSAPSIKLKMIANAAGGLLPSLARELRQVFQANVLPSYGMTECMPITSPPANYQLEKPGTSGVAVGPEVAILNRETCKPLPVATEGPICVRGAPCFRGYGMDNSKPMAEKPASCFLRGGWFDTGDLGYMDSDGYLYITGRSKEVINRGGEIISPLEVEEAVLSHPLVEACVAFSALHDVLQEVVGIVVVPVSGRPKVDLHSLQDHLGQGLLAAPKWPQCLVYIDALPKSHTNKLLRVKLGHRMRVPELNDNMHPIERTFTAKCPPQGTPIKVAIPCERVSVQPSVVENLLRKDLNMSENGGRDLKVVPHPSRIGSLVAHVYDVDRLHLVKLAKEKLDAYLVPSHICLMAKPKMREDELLAPEPSDAIVSILSESRGSSGLADPMVTELKELFRDLLDLDCVPDPDTNFFNLGGSSLLASQLASRIRKKYRVQFGGAEVFHHSTCNTIAFLIRDRLGQTPPESTSSLPSETAPDSSSGSSLYQDRNVETHGAPFPPNRLNPERGIFSYLFQLVPLCIVCPFFVLIRFFCFFMCLLYVLRKVPYEQNFIQFIVTVVIFHLSWVIITPLIFVILKWLIIGKYKEGRYAVWGSYYLRWWFVETLRKFIGKGIWGSNGVLLNLYYRLLGAHIGKGARISPQAEVAEFDLVSIGDGAGIEYSTVRGFGVDNGCIILGPVKVGDYASVGITSIVPPFTAVAEGVHMGPATSTYELGNCSSDHADYNRQCLPEPNLLVQIFIGGPITFFVDTISHIPAALMLYWMISMPWHHDEPFETVTDLMEWLCDIRRIPFFIGIRVVRVLVAPFVYISAALMVKWILIGKFRPGPRDTSSQWQLLRYWLSDTLFSRENLQEVTDIVGRHYQLVSVLYRLLGAKVGERVFWPGHLPIFTGEFDLLEIGDDVVFGSRTSLICTTVDSSEKIILCAGANVSDNTVVLPGSIIGKNAVIGSNTICPAGRYLPESSVWLGSRNGNPVRLERGTEPEVDDIMLSSEVKAENLQFTGDETTLRPFGKGYYNREASYFVYPLPFIIAFTVASTTIIATVHTIPILGSLHLAAGYFFGFHISERDYSSDRYSVETTNLFFVLLVSMFFTHLIRVGLWLGLEYSAKWGLMGERQEGRHNYDTSDYGQRWELYQIISRVRNMGRMNMMDFIAGTPYMSTFFRLNGCKIGIDCCLYPAGGDPYMPEPDLCFIGDQCIVDKASIVAHLNTRGNFELTKIIVGNHVTLRSRSRIQQGVHMESGSMILEKSLVMTGEIIEADSVWQGAPAALLFMYDTVSLHSVMYGDAVDDNLATEVTSPYKFLHNGDACSC